MSNIIVKFKSKRNFSGWVKTVFIDIPEKSKRLKEFSVDQLAVADIKQLTSFPKPMAY